MKWVSRLGVSAATVGLMTFFALLSPPSGLASIVQVVGRDANGTVLLKSGDLTTPTALPLSSSPAVAIALIGQGVGPIFGSVVFPGAKPIPEFKPLPAPPLPSQVPTSLQQVSEPSQISYGLTYGGIASLPATSVPPGTGRITLTGTVGGAATVTLTGTAGGTTITHLAAVAGPRVMPNPLPGTVGLFLTGLGAGFGTLRLLCRQRRPGS